MSLLAQAAGDNGSTLNIGVIAAQVGLSGVFLWQWTEERKERRAAQAALAVLFERLLPVLEEATSTLERVQIGMERQVDKATHVIGATPHDLAEALRHVEDLARDLHDRLPPRDRGDRRREERR